MTARSIAWMGAVFVWVAAPSAARAESGTWNLHLDAAFAVPIYGELAPTTGSDYAFGGGGTFAVDWQLAPPVAIELIGGAGYLTRADRAFGMAGAGVRLRFLDNHEGYANEPGGDYDGNYWVSAHVGYLNLDGSEFGIDLGTGYEWSVVRPLQIGVFVRGEVGLTGNGNQPDILVTAGLSFSLAVGEAAAVDTDHDQLSDERESARWHTDPNNPDSDADGLNDGLEAHTDTDPTRPDTDGDGLADGVEDANHDGGLSPGESDPRHADTDNGGTGDAFEHNHPGYDPRNPADDDQDHDGVTDEHDACLATPPHTEVDARGCAVIHAAIVLDGIEFQTDSTAILPTSEQTLQRAIAILKDNPTVHVEVAGYTDNVGTHAHNETLSHGRAQSVHDWLVAHGIPAAQMTVRGYAESHPRGDNATEEGRAQNRRIEFHRIGGEEHAAAHH